jgi:hypothetical protein
MLRHACGRLFPLICLHKAPHSHGDPVSAASLARGRRELAGMEGYRRSLKRRLFHEPVLGSRAGSCGALPANVRGNCGTPHRPTQRRRRGKFKSPMAGRQGENVARLVPARATSCSECDFSPTTVIRSPISALSATRSYSRWKGRRSTRVAENVPVAATRGRRLYAP